MFIEISEEGQNNIYRSLLRMMKSKRNPIQISRTNWNNDEVLLILFNETTKSINLQQAESFWKTMSYALMINDTEIEHERKKVFASLRKSFLRDLDFVKKLDKLHLITLGQEQLWCQEVLIALIRRHILETGSSDPFADKAFTYEWVDPSPRNPSLFKIANFYTQCKSLPVDDIVLIGKQNQALVHFLMESFRNCHDFFDISAQFAIHYPSFRKEIATEWVEILNTFPMGKKQRNKIASIVKNLRSNYNEFKGINVEENHDAYYTAGGVSTLAISSGLGWYLRKCLIAKCLSNAGVVIAGNAAPLILPLIACTGFHLIYEQNKKSKKLEMADRNARIGLLLG